MTRIAVAGATGQVGSVLVEVLHDAGHDVVPLARSAGVDVLEGTGLDDALTGVDAVVDVLSTAALDAAETVAFFGGTSRSLLAAEARAGVGHHVLLSIVGCDAVPGNGHYAGKVAQEAEVRGGAVPWTIVRATQFFEFPATVAGWTTSDGVATVAPLLLQPVALADVARALADAATATPLNATTDLAGPETHDLVDLARRTFAARGDTTALRASWRDQPFGLDMAGEVLLPGPGATIGTTTVEQWLEQQRR